MDSHSAKAIHLQFDHTGKVLNCIDVARGCPALGIYLTRQTL